MLCSPAEPGKPVTVSVTGAAASAALSVSGVLLYFLPDSGFVVVGHLAQAGTGTNASGLPTATLTSSAVSADYAGQPLTAAVVLGDGFAPAASPTGTVPAAALMAQAATVTFTVATSNSATAPASPPPTAAWVVGGAAAVIVLGAVAGVAVRAWRRRTAAEEGGAA